MFCPSFSGPLQNNDTCPNCRAIVDVNSLFFWKERWVNEIKLIIKDVIIGAGSAPVGGIAGAAIGIGLKLATPTVDLENIEVALGGVGASLAFAAAATYQEYPLSDKALRLLTLTLTALVETIGLGVLAGREVYAREIEGIPITMLVAAISSVALGILKRHSWPSSQLAPSPEKGLPYGS